MTEKFKPMPEGAVFVFGSNEAGYHGGGAAREAYEKFGAVWNKGIGHYGQSYALPTKDTNVQTLPLAHIQHYVDRFLDYVMRNPNLTFYLTKIGCGLAGLTEEQIKPMFAGRRYDNIIYPYGWE